MTPQDCPNAEVCAFPDAAKQWHLDRSVSIGHIVTTMVALCAFIAWAMRQNDRLTRLEDHAVVATAVDERQERERKELREEFRQEFRDIKAMLEARRR